MKIERKDFDELNAQIDIIIEPDDYQFKFKEELNKYRAKTQMKGFRKGKIPLSSIKKMYGKSLMAEIVNEILQKELNEYLKKDKIEILGNPIPSDSQERIDFDLNGEADFTFKFDIGMAPNFNVSGVAETDEYESYEVTTPVDVINKELEMLRKKHGKTIHPTDDIKEDDILMIEAKELEGSEVKEKAWETAFTMLVSRIGDEKVKKEVLKAKAGASFNFDIYSLEKEASEAYVKKYLLNLDEGEEKEIGKDFVGFIKEVSRIEPAEYNQEFFDLAFGEAQVSSEEEAVKKIEGELSKHYDEQQRNLTYKYIMDRLVDDNVFELPGEFLKRWIKLNNKEVAETQIDKEFEDFSANLRWSLIKSKLVKEFAIEIQPEEVKETVKKKLSKYIDPSQAQGLDMEAIAMNYLSRENQLEKEYEEMLAERLFAEICNRVKLNPKKVSVDEFRDLVQKTNDKNVTMDK
jgi:trigger factor